MSLRERKKLAAWRAIRESALRLFDEQGYEATTIEQIAARANVSRATFFNYFESKDAVIRDLDPEERASWLAIMLARPTDEPLWESLCNILIAFNRSLRERMLLQRTLTSLSHEPSAENLSAQFRADLGEWVRLRPNADAHTSFLQLNLALTASNTAYHTWTTQESFDDYLERVERFLRFATPTIAR